MCRTIRIYSVFFHSYELYLDEKEFLKLKDPKFFDIAEKMKKHTRFMSSFKSLYKKLRSSVYIAKNGFFN